MTKETEQLTRLKKELNSEKLPEKKINILLNLGYNYFPSNLKHAQFYTRTAIHLAQQLKNNQMLGQAFNLLSDILRLQGRWSKAREYAAQALKIGQNENNQETEGDALNNLGLLAWHKGEFEAAIKYFKDSLKIREDSKDKQRISVSYNNLGLLFCEMGDLSSARAYLEKSLKIKEKISDETGKGVSFLNLGLVYSDLGDWEKALEYYFRALAIKEKRNEKVDIGLCYNNIGEVFLRTGKLEKAKDFMLLALRYANEVKSPWVKAEVLGNLGEAHFLEGDSIRAENLYDEGQKICQTIEDKEELTETYRRKAELFISAGRTDEAFIFAKRGLTIALKCKLKKEEGNLKRVLGSIYWSLKREKESAASFIEAIEIFKSMGRNFELGKAYFEYGRNLKMQGEPRTFPLTKQDEDEKSGSSLASRDRMERGESKTAESYLKQAAEIFKNLGAIYYFEKVSSILAHWETPAGNKESLLVSLTNAALKTKDTTQLGNYVLELLANFSRAKTGYFHIYGLPPIIYGEMKEDEIIHRRVESSDIVFPIKIEEKEIGMLLLKEGSVAIAESFIQTVANIISLSLENYSRKTGEVKKVLSYEFPGVKGIGKKMQELWATIEKVAPTKATVLITGESGTGKELIARAIHNLSPFSKELFLPINCAAIPETLLETELFGIEKGTATGVMERSGKFEIAKGGTIFLDEVGDMSLALQAKILRVLQERKFFRVGGKQELNLEARIIAATNKDLAEEIKKGNFRQDLFFRLSVIAIPVPSLRERQEDIFTFINYFITKYGAEYNKDVKGITKEVQDLFLNYDWQGNIRELENTIERAIILCDCEIIAKDDLPPQLKLIVEKISPELKELKEKYQEQEKETILKLLTDNEWKIIEVTKILGVNRKRLYRLMQKYEIKKP